MKTCCYHCQNRSVGCHAFCNEYNDFRKTLEKNKAQIRAEKSERDFLFSVKERMMKKNVK